MDSLFITVTELAKGSFQFEINHLKTKDMPTGTKISSPKFLIGPHDWVINYYPQGSNKEYKGKYVSFFLKLQGGSQDVAVKYGFLLFDKHGNKSSASLRKLSHTFTPGGGDWGWSLFLERTELEKNYVKDGNLVLQVSIKRNDELYKEAAHWISSPSEILLKDIKTFRDKNKHIDITFDVDGKNFFAHRLILAAQSPVFEAELFGSMAESNLKCVQIKEMVPSVFKAMLDFMYNGYLPVVNEKLIEDDQVMSYVSFLEKLLAAADRYAVEHLKTICEQRLRKLISMDTVLSLLELAEGHNCSELKQDCLQFIVDKENTVSIMVSEGYISLMHNYPSLLVELKVILARKGDSVQCLKQGNK